MEIFIALKKLAAASETADTAAKGANTTATGAATTSTWGFNMALLANPIVLIIVGAIALAAALIALEQKFGLVTKGIDASTAAFKDLLGWVDGAKDAIFGLGDAVEEFVEDKLEKLGALGDLIG